MIKKDIDIDYLLVPFFWAPQANTLVMLVKAYIGMDKFLMDEGRT